MSNTTLGPAARAVLRLQLPAMSIGHKASDRLHVRHRAAVISTVEHGCSAHGGTWLVGWLDAEGGEGVAGGNQGEAQFSA